MRLAIVFSASLLALAAATPALADKGGIPNSNSNGHASNNPHVSGAPAPLIGIGAPFLLAGAGLVISRIRRQRR